MYEEVLEKFGGFGLYQFLLLFLQFVTTNYGNQLVFNNGFLTAAPKFKCINKEDLSDDFNWYTCSREQICDKGSIFDNIEYKFDREDPSYFRGFFE